MVSGTSVRSGCASPRLMKASMDEFFTQKQWLGNSTEENTMTDSTYNVMMPDKGVPIKAWTKGVPLEDAARQQLLNVAQLPFIYKWVAAMPDVHWGIGATVGSVIPTRGAIIPAAVGVDIGCGMMAVQTSLHANQLPDNLHGIRTAIEKAVPHGRTDNGGKNDRGAWSDAPTSHLDVWAARSNCSKFLSPYQNIVGAGKGPRGCIALSPHGSRN